MSYKAKANLARQYNAAVAAGKFLDVSDLNADGTGSVQRSRPLVNEWAGIGRLGIIEPLIIMSDKYGTYEYAIRLLGADKQYADEFRRRYGTEEVDLPITAPEPVLVPISNKLPSRTLPSLASSRALPSLASSRVLPSLASSQGKLLTLKEIRDSITDRSTEDIDDIHYQFLPVFGYFLSVPSCSIIFQLREAIIDLGVMRHILYNYDEVDNADLVIVKASNALDISNEDLVRSIQISLKNAKIRETLESGRTYFFEGISVSDLKGQKVFQVQWGS